MPNRKGRRLPFVLKAAVGVLIGLALAELLLQAAGFVLASRWERVGAGTGGKTILCVGDSHTFGLGVLAPQAYPNRLHALLNTGRRPDRYRVISRGVPGRNSAVVRERLPAYLQRFRPCVAIILVGYNNSWNNDETGIREGHRGAWSRMKGFFSKLKLVKLFNLARLNLHGDAQEAERETPFRITAEGNRFFVEEDGERRPINPGEGARAGLYSGAALTRITQTDLEACVRICRNGNTNPVLMTYALEGGDFDAVNAAARKAARSTGALLIDLARSFAPLLRKDRSAWILPDGTHLNAAGYERMAGIIADRLIAEGLVEAPPPPEKEKGGSKRVRSPLDLRLRILSGGGDRPPRMEVNGPKGTAFQLFFSKSMKTEGDPGIPGIPGIALDDLVTLSCTVPSFRGIFGTKPLVLSIPSTILDRYTGRTLYCCLAALDEHAPDPARSVLAVTPPTAVKVP